MSAHAGQCNSIRRHLRVEAAPMLCGLILLLLFMSSNVAAYNPPIDAVMDTSIFPQDVLQPAEGETNLLERIRVKDFLYTEVQNATQKDIGALITGKLIIEGGLRLQIPGLEVFEIIVANGEFDFSAQIREEVPVTPPPPDYCLGATYSFCLKVTSIPISLRLKTDLLRPIKQKEDGTWEEYAYDETLKQYQDAMGHPVYPDLTNTVDVIIRYTFDGEPELNLVDPSSGATAKFSVSTPFMIGESGVVLNITSAIVDLSDTSSPTGISDPAWKGVKFDKFAVNFTGALELPELSEGTGTTTRPELASIALTNFTVGTGGFSGKISGTAAGLISIPLGGLDLELAGIDLEFKQNALIKSGVTGIVRPFPFFEKDVKLELALDMLGNFKVGIAADDPNRNAGGLVEWEIANVLKLEVQSMAFEYEEKVFYTTLNGTIIPQFFDSDVKAAADSDPRINVNGLRIGSDGKVSLEGGWVTLPEKRYIDFNAFRIELAAIGFGADETAGSQKWMGFSGGVALVEGLSANAGFKKLQFMWPKKNGGPGVDVKLQGVEVGFSKPGVVTFKGSADWFEDAGKKGFAGSILVNLEFISTSVNGRLVIGQTIPNVSAPVTPVGTCQTTPNNSAFKFFYLDLEANLPTGIPVFSNVSIYGFMGLLAVNMEPHVCAFPTPLKWFKAHTTATNVVDGQPPPWIPSDGAFAVGLGVILGTSSDDGYVINTKVALMVALPGPLVMLNGMGNVVKARGDLVGATDPLFAAIAIFDGRQSIFLINLGIYYKIPDSGELIDLSAETEAYFNLRDPGDWHLWLGKKTPESERIRVTVLKFLDASAYYMLDPASLQFGAKAGYDSRPNWKFGPLGVELAAWIGYDVAISWRPIHAWGAAELGGHAKLKAFGFGIGLTANARLEIETPTPYVIDGKFNVKLNLPWPLPDPKASVHLRWEKQRPKPALDQLVTKIGLESSKDTSSVTASINRNTTVAAGSTLDTTTLCSAWESLPVIPEVDEDLNGNGVLDAGEDFNGDGVLNVSTPTPACTGKPLVPVTYRPVVAFGRNTNDRLAGAGQPTLVGNTGNYRDNIGEGTYFEYDLTSLKIWAKRKATTPTLTLTSGDVLPEVYGAWPALVGDPEQPGALYVKLWSKNPFSIYDSSTFLFYENGTGSWPEWFAETYSDYPCEPGHSEHVECYNVGHGRICYPTIKHEACVDPTILEQKDLILPPYHVFAVAVESEADATGDATGKTYRDVAYFHTEGVPLNLDAFVFNTVPGTLDELHYRNYDIGLRFNETYMDLLYKEPGSLDELRYKDPLQKLVVEIIDENGEPARDQDGNLVTITTSWVQAPDHIDTRNDQKWLDLMQDNGIPISTATIPTDDMVYASLDWPGGLRASAQYTARVWFEDKRLLTDSRVNDVIWRKDNKVRHIDGQRVLLYEYNFITSAFNSFAELGGSYEGKWWPLEVSAFNSVIINQEIAKAIERGRPFPATVNMAHKDRIARFLAQAFTSLVPDNLAPGEMDKALARIPGFDVDLLTMSDADRTDIISKWEDEREAFARVDSHFELDRAREPLPHQVELNALKHNGVYKGFLIELPEPIEWARVNIVLQKRPDEVSAWVTSAPATIINVEGTRAFIFNTTAGSVANLEDVQYRVRLTFSRTIGSRNPLLHSTFPEADEVVDIIATLPDGHFVPETP